jgi:hypothetical protein
VLRMQPRGPQQMRPAAPRGTSEILLAGRPACSPRVRQAAGRDLMGQLSRLGWCEFGHLVPWHLAFLLLFTPFLASSLFFTVLMIHFPDRQPWKFLL